MVREHSVTSRILDAASYYTTLNQISVWYPPLLSLVALLYYIVLRYLLSTFKSKKDRLLAD
jgi:phosphotransferase system  glucose/maltose/N-acetylglucosamine-specific IIC component